LIKSLYERCKETQSTTKRARLWSISI
jgi:hypothetical protein